MKREKIEEIIKQYRACTNNDAKICASYNGCPGHLAKAIHTYHKAELMRVLKNVYKEVESRMDFYSKSDMDSIVFVINDIKDKIDEAIKENCGVEE